MSYLLWQYYAFKLDITSKQIFVTDAKGINIQPNYETTEFETKQPAVEQTTVLPSTNISDVNKGVSKEINNTVETNIKIINEKQQIPESASKVLLPFLANNTYNILTYQTKKHNQSDEFSKENVNVREKFPTRKVEKKNDLRAHVRYDEVTGEVIDGGHPCERECREGEEPIICYYHFSLEWYHTMSKACYNCPYNEDDCKRMDCIPADGMSRALNVINRKMPGPAVEVSVSLFTFTLKLIKSIFSCTTYALIRALL